MHQTESVTRSPSTGERQERSHLGNVVIKEASPSDLGEVLDVLEEAARWLLSRGIRQWPARFPKEPIARSIEIDEVFLACERGRAVATLTLQSQDDIWPESRDYDAFYLHRLAVRRGHAGLGRALLSWAETHTATTGRRYLRLDCWQGNSRLRAYYEQEGFSWRGDVQEEYEGSRYQISLYQKEVSIPSV